VVLNGRDVTDDPPYARAVNTVFQDYALFPHMSVLENVAYGPRVRGKHKDDWRKRAGEMLELVQLGHFGDRRPAQLSGGQRQRVSLARALINQPPVLLLDEPLGALDLKLREEMQIELKNLQRRLGITFVFVTHDQGEALSMADRVAVFNRGKIEQLDTPRVLYTKPTTAFVARFVGSANVVTGELARRLSGRAEPFAVRAENIRLRAPTTTPNGDTMSCIGDVADVQYHGAMSRWQVRLESGEVFAAAVSDTNGNGDFRVGARVRLEWARGDAVLLTATEAP
jgi:putative spermidine/putrescine transport system ATP-binding protein